MESDLLAIRNEDAHIRDNYHEMKAKYERCLNNFAENLQQEIDLFENYDKNKRDKTDKIREIFKESYEDMTNNAEKALRKIKWTYSIKKEFWTFLIENNFEMEDKNRLNEFNYEKQKAAENEKIAIQENIKQLFSYEKYFKNSLHEAKEEPLKEFQLTNINLSIKMNGEKASRFERSFNQTENSPMRYDEVKRFSERKSVKRENYFKTEFLDEFMKKN